MRIVCVIDGLGFGGAERSLAEMLPGLIDAGIQPTIASLHRREGGVQGDVLARGFDVRFLPARPMARLRALRRLIREISPDLIHTTLVPSSLTGRIAAVGTDIPVLTSLVNQSYTAERMADPHVHPSAVRSIRAIDGWTARHLTTHFHAITYAVKRSAVDGLGVPADRISVVERGRDPLRLGAPGVRRRARARVSLGIPVDAEVVLAVGRQEFQKGHRFLLEAMRTLASTRPQAILLLAGRDGAESDRLRRMADEPPLDRAVRFLGHRSDLPEVLAASDVFAFPSLWEGLGCALIEAMALRLPIVASDLEPVREVVEDGSAASLVVPRDARGLATAITSLLEDPSRARSLGAAGREIFLRRFTLARSTERMVDLFRRIGSKADRGPAPHEVEVA